MVSLHAADRRLVWRFDSGEPVTALSLPSEGGCAVFGTKSGLAVMLAEGEKKWGLTGAGEVSALAASADASKVAVARDDGEGRHTVECVSASGAVFHSLDAPSSVLSAAWSPSGRHLVLSCADGSLLGLETEASSGRGADLRRAKELLAGALEMIGAGRHAEALPRLETALQLDPSNLEAAAALSDAASRSVRDSIWLAGEALVGAECSRAVEILDEAWGRARAVPGVVPELMDARKDLTARMLDLARELLKSGSPDDALEVLVSLLNLDPGNTDARSLLAKAGDQAADRLARGAEEASASGAFSEAASLWEQVMEHRPSDEARAKLSEARRDEALARGMELYAEKRYAQAAFEFRRVLSLDPGNDEARRHLEYAQDLAGDDSLLDRFRLLE